MYKFHIILGRFLGLLYDGYRNNESMEKENLKKEAIKNIETILKDCEINEFVYYDYIERIDIGPFSEYKSIDKIRIKIRNGILKIEIYSEHSGESKNEKIKEFKIQTPKNGNSIDYSIMKYTKVELGDYSEIIYIDDVEIRFNDDLIFKDYKEEKYYNTKLIFEENKNKKEKNDLVKKVEEIVDSIVTLVLLYLS